MYKFEPHNYLKILFCYLSIAYILIQYSCICMFYTHVFIKLKLFLLCSYSVGIIILVDYVYHPYHVVIDFSYEIIYILVNSHYLCFPFCIAAQYVFYGCSFEIIACVCIESNTTHMHTLNLLSTCVIEFSYQ